MQYRIVINLAVCAFSCFVANDLATDIYGERCKRVLLNILTNAVYVFLLMDMMLFPYAMILFPVIVFLGFMALSVNYNVDKKKMFGTNCAVLVALVVLYTFTYMFMKGCDDGYETYIMFTAIEYIVFKAYLKMKETTVTFTGILIIIIPVLYFSFTIYMLNNASFNDKEKLVMFFVIVVINILMIVFYNEFIKQYKIALNKKAMVEQYNSIKNQVSTMAETNEKMRRIRHDMRNHMIVMEQMLDDKNYDRLKLYMQKMAAIAHENEQKIDTGNIELDAILNNKINEAQNSNIKTETDITYDFDVATENTYEDCYVYVAVYDENGILCAINRVPLETTGNTSVSVDKNDNAKKAKVFVFSSTLQPIITSEEFPLICRKKSLHMQALLKFSVFD